MFYGYKGSPYHLLLAADHFYGVVLGKTISDITEYGLNTLNEDGYLNLLPIFLDSIFNPSFLPSIYKTEIHHIDDNGLDNGRVYNEMRHKYFCQNQYYYSGWTFDENIENEFGSSSVSDTKDIACYPSLETLKKYHKEYYRLNNSVLTIRGPIDHEKVLALIGHFENMNNFKLSPINHVVYEIKFKNKIKVINIPTLASYGFFDLIWNAKDITVCFKSC